MLPAANAGASFHAAISSGKFHGNDLPANAHRLAQSVIEHLPRNRNRLAFDLRGPTGEVFKVFDYVRQIDVERFLDRLAVVGVSSAASCAASASINCESL